jgi:hypothetical protein
VAESINVVGCESFSSSSSSHMPNLYKGQDICVFQELNHICLGLVTMIFKFVNKTTST